jgi:hypothetical protein
MKKILIAALLLAMSGCTLVNSYLMTSYDPNEYQMITNIRFRAQEFKTQCNDANNSSFNARRISQDTRLFVLYSEHIPRNDNLIAAGKALNVIAQGLEDQYNNSKVSPLFCKIKFESIETSAEKMQTVIGWRPR